MKIFHARKMKNSTRRILWCYLICRKKLNSPISIPMFFLSNAAFLFHTIAYIYVIQIPPNPYSNRNLPLKRTFINLQKSAEKSQNGKLVEILHER